MPGTLSLIGGVGPHEGNVHLNGMPVCSYEWGLADAWVACKQGGFLGVSQVHTFSSFGQVSSLHIRSHVRCSGKEIDLLDCDRYVYISVLLPKLQNCIGVINLSAFFFQSPS